MCNSVADCAHLLRKERKPMKYDLQKASMLKRISAWLLDMILLLVLASGFGLCLSVILDYNQHSDALFACYDRYETQYGVDFDITAEEYEKLSQEDRDRFDEASKALMNDSEAAQAYSLVVSMSLVIVSISILLGYLVLEFIIPLWLKNGQTVGKKVFGIALMRADGVRLTPFMLFVRTVLGKYTIETMIPVLAISMLLLGTMGAVSLTVLAVILVAEIVLMIRSRTNATIHDYMSATVAVDMASQMIFDSPEALMAYNRQVHAEEVRKQIY